jgi:hypothetical protein
MSLQSTCNLTEGKSFGGRRTFATDRAILNIVRLDKIQQFNGINLEFGYKPLAIYLPREVTTYEREE